MDSFKKNILNCLETKYVPHKGLKSLAENIARSLKFDEEETYNALCELEKEGEIYEFNRNKYSPIALLNMKKGKISASGYGYSFLRVENGEDIFIAEKNTLNSFDGDEVLVKVITQPVGDKKGEGKVIKVLNHANAEVVGTFFKQPNNGRVISDNTKFDREILISNANSLDAKPGDKVVVKVFDFEKGKTLWGKVTEVLGGAKDKGTDLKSILRTYKVKEEFPDEVLNAAQEVPQEVSNNAKKNRNDLTELMCFTIDGDDAKDFDDAVSLSTNPNGTYRLGVHIADVGHYVPQDSTIDKEAYARGTSIYYLNHVIPMLPVELSNGICSINPNVERLALTVFMDIDQTGKVQDYEISESVIKSKYRLTYNEVQKMLDGDKDICNKYKEILPTILDMSKLSQILDKERVGRGAINFEIPECKIIVDENGKPVEIGVREYNQSNKIIETFMVVANEVVAQKFVELNLPFVYRVHEKPNVEKVSAFFGFLESLGVNVSVDMQDIKPMDFQKILNEVEKESYAKVVNMLMLRSLKKAKYLPDCLGHFGLASTFYCHFTSPIRRYPDLTIHRIIKKYLRGDKTVKSPELVDFVEKSSMQSSEREKLSEELERAVEDYKKCEYMQQFIGQQFEGTINSVLNKGVFVELDNTCEGYANVENMPQDYYTLNEKTLCLVGKNGFFRIGDRVVIEVLSCNLSEKKVAFKLIKKI